MCVIGHLFLGPFVQSPSVHAVDRREESAGETESRIRTSPPSPPGHDLGALFRSVEQREQDGCTPNCKSCLRVRVTFARKELLAIIFSSIVFKSRSECALGACWGGVGAWAHSRGRRASWCGRSHFPPGFQEFSLHLQTAEVSLSGAWGRGEPTGDLGARPGASESCVIVGSVPDRPSADGGQGRLGSEMGTLSAEQQPGGPAERPFESWEVAKGLGVRGPRTRSLEEGIAQRKALEAFHLSLKFSGVDLPRANSLGADFDAEGREEDICRLARLNHPRGSLLRGARWVSAWGMQRRGWRFF